MTPDAERDPIGDAAPGDAAPVLFREDRRLRAPMLWAVVLASSAFGLGTVLWVAVETLQKDPRGLWNPDVVVPSAIALAVWGLALALLGTLRLQVEVTARGLFVRMWPLQWRVRMVDLGNVVQMRAVRFRPIRDYGGYGLRWTWRGRGYILEGDEGVRIDYANGYHLLIESRRARELAAAIGQLLDPSR